MKIYLLDHKRRLFIGPLVVLALSLVLPACAQGSGQGSGSSTGGGGQKGNDVIE